MIEKHSVSRRASLKTLGVAGAALALGGAVPSQTEPKPATRDVPSAGVVDVAVERLLKGHS